VDLLLLTVYGELPIPNDELTWSISWLHESSIVASVKLVHVYYFTHTCGFLVQVAWLESLLLLNSSFISHPVFKCLSINMINSPHKALLLKFLQEELISYLLALFWLKLSLLGEDLFFISWFTRCDSQEHVSEVVDILRVA
jgi:hypothetical protein